MNKHIKAQILRALAVPLLASVGWGAPASAEVCKPDQIKPTTSPEQFLDHRDGTVTDARTGLMWARCSMGQTFDNGDCRGTPRRFESWQTALEAVAGLNATGGLAGYTDYRLPNIKELFSIVEYSCFNPAIQLSIFPSTPSGTFLSSTPSFDSLNPARSVNFTSGSEITSAVNAGLVYVRVVRTPSGASGVAGPGGPKQVSR